MSVRQQKCANDDLKVAERRDVGVAELSVRRFGGRVARRLWPTGGGGRIVDDGSAPMHHPPRNAAQCRGGASLLHMNGNASDSKAGCRMIMDSLNPTEECRRMWTSVWLHFPHIELGFLFFAFEGSVVSQLSAILYSECGWVKYTAVAILVSAVNVARIRTT